MVYVILVIASLIASNSVQAQTSVNLNFNVGSQPVWGPVGYDYVEYYYFPDIEMYYNVPERTFFCFEHGRWVGRPWMPFRYRHYDLYHSYKVAVNEHEPYRHHERNKIKYYSYKDRRDQQPIRDSRDSKYFVIQNHPEHKNWISRQKHGGGKGRGQGNKY